MTESKGGRFVATGGALGAGLAIVGGLSAASAAASEAEPTSEPATVVRQVVVPGAQVPQPQQIIVVIPDSFGAGAAQVAAPATAAPAALPEKPTPAPAAPKAEPAPVAQSEGS